MAADNTALLKRAEQGDREAEALLVEENMGLVWSIVRRFAGRGYELEDLSQIGAIGLMKAVKKFDMSYDVKFSTYAVPMIIGEIKRFLRDDGAIKVSRSLKETAMKGCAIRDRLMRELGRDVTIEEISSETGIPPEELAQAFEAITPLESIDRELYDAGEKSISLADKLPAPSCEDTSINRVMIQDALSRLKPRERQIIVLRYFQGKTQTETSKLIGVSQVQISRIEKNTLKKIHDMLEE